MAEKTVPRFIEECQLCESRNIKEMALYSYGGVYVSSGLFHNAGVYVRVCLDCGNIVQSYVKEPHKLIKNNKNSKNKW